MKRAFMILVLIIVVASYALPGSGEVTSAVTGRPLAGRETVCTQFAAAPSNPVSSVEGVPIDGDLAQYRPATDTGLCLFSFRCPAEWTETVEVTCRRLPGERYSVSLNLPGLPDLEGRILTFLLCEHGKTDVTKMPTREIASLRDNTGRTLDLSLTKEILNHPIEVCVINSFKPPAVRTVETGRSVSLSVPHEPFAVPASGTDRALHRTSA